MIGHVGNYFCFCLDRQEGDDQSGYSYLRSVRYVSSLFVGVCHADQSFLSGEENRKGDNSPENRVKKIMEKLDINDDKNISRDEFVDGCLKDDVLRQLLAPNV
jgi:Ca2+-binding EF-hand superfamily protein